MTWPLISIRSVFEYHLVSGSLFTGVSKISYTQLSPALLLYFYCWHFPNILYLYLFILFFWSFLTHHSVECMFHEGENLLSFAHCYFPTAWQKTV